MGAVMVVGWGRELKVGLGVGCGEGVARLWVPLSCIILRGSMPRVFCGWVPVGGSSVLQRRLLLLVELWVLVRGWVLGVRVTKAACGPTICGSRGRTAFHRSLQLCERRVRSVHARRAWPICQRTAAGLPHSMRVWGRSSGNSRSSRWRRRCCSRVLAVPL